MNGLEGIRSINASAELQTRALAYVTNNPGVSVTEAKVILAGEDAIAARKHSERVNRAKHVAGIHGTHRTNRSGK